MNHISDSLQNEIQRDYRRAIAQKIRNRLQQLNNATEQDKRRWIWELIQNAVDTLQEGEKIDIEIVINTDYLEFRHNGGYFVLRNITNLVHQISSKEGQENAIGRFGTGFLTTHTLSRKVEVEGIWQEEKGDTRFTLTLDRSGNTENELIEGIKNSWETIRSDEVNTIEKQWTVFRYLQPDLTIAQDTIRDFETFVGYSLAFVPKINTISISIQNNLENTHTIYSQKENSESSHILVFNKEINGENTEIQLFYLSDEKVSIAIEIENDTIKPIPKNTPRLFCAYPLIGTEDFYFPFVINSTYFKPKTERDNLYLYGETPDVSDNKNLLINALYLYEQAVSLASENNWKNLYLLAQHFLPPEDNDLDLDWYKQDIQKPIQKYLFTIPIVENENGLLYIRDVLFPSHEKEEVRTKIWNFLHDLFPQKVTKETHIEYWYEITKNWLDVPKEEIAELTSKVAQQQNIANLATLLKKEVYPWLNQFVAFIEQTASYLLDKQAILPNQYGTFCLKKDLYEDINTIPDVLKVILKELDANKDWKTEFLDLAIHSVRMNNKNRTLYNISQAINEIIRKLNYETDEKNRNIILQLISYKNQKQTEKHQKVWEFARSFYYENVPESITILENTNDFDWETSLDWVMNRLVRDIAAEKYTDRIQKLLYGNIKVIDWLNDLIGFLQNDTKLSALLDSEDFPILPNQNGRFCYKSQLYLDNGELPKALKEILQLLAPQWIDELLDTKIYLRLPEGRVRKFEDIAKKVDTTFEEYSDSKQNPKFVKAWRLFWDWIKSQKSSIIFEFDWIYRNKAQTSLDIIGDEEQKDAVFEIVESGNAHLFKKMANGLSKENMEELAENPERYEQLKKLEANKDNLNVTIKAEILAKINKELGENYATFDDFIKQIKNSKRKIDFAKVSSNTPPPNWEAIKKSNEMAKEKLYERLKKDEDYDVSAWNKDSNTIISGIKKKGIEMKIVVKGANNGIIYFDAAQKEREVLSHTFSELWVHYQEEVFQITLGEVIKEWDVRTIKAHLFKFN